MFLPVFFIFFLASHNHRGYFSYPKPIENTEKYKDALAKIRKLGYNYYIIE